MTALPKTKQEYTIMATQGQGGAEVGKFNTLEEALKYVDEHEGEASFGFVYPNGTWHEWE